METLHNAVHEADKVATEECKEDTILSEIRDRKSNGNQKPVNKSSISLILHESMKVEEE
jgi:hypothetical protein